MPNRSMKQDDPLEDFTRRQIALDGIIKAVFPNVKVEGHADKVLNALKS